MLTKSDKIYLGFPSLDHPDDSDQRKVFQHLYICLLLVFHFKVIGLNKLFIKSATRQKKNQ